MILPNGTKIRIKPSNDYWNILPVGTEGIIIGNCFDDADHITHDTPDWTLYTVDFNGRILHIGASYFQYLKKSK